MARHAKTIVYRHRKLATNSFLSGDALYLHLLNRLTFGTSITGLQNLQQLGQSLGSQSQAVSSFVTAQLKPNSAADPVPDLPLTTYSYTLQDIQTWWLQKMYASPNQLLEKMTLFWHTFFPTGNRRVLNPYLLYLQNRTIRANALKPFPQLLKAMATDGAMLLWLNGAQNNAGPTGTGSYGVANENFGREVLQRYSLGAKADPVTGVSFYTEDDVRAGARAWSGWVVGSNPPYTVSFDPTRHDDRAKSTLGGTVPARTGTLGSQDITSMINLILGVRSSAGTISQVAYWVCLRLLQFFWTPQPQTADIITFGKIFDSTGGDISQVLYALFNSPLFVSTGTFRGLVKSPIEHYLSMLKFLQPSFSFADHNPFLPGLSNQGQELLNPPSVFGWPQYTDWYSYPNLIERVNTVPNVTVNPLYDAVSLAAQVPNNPAYSSRGQMVYNYFLNILCQGVLPVGAQNDIYNYFISAPFDSTTCVTNPERVEGMLTLLMTTPEFNLH
jgi:uncharacterized protein (DUF1800 family)